MLQEKLSYSKIEGIIDQLIHKLGGSNSVISLLESMLTSLSDTENQPEVKRHSMIALHISLYVCVEFGITMQELINGNNKYAIQRGACFYFHKKYADKVSIRAYCNQFSKQQPAYYNGIKSIQNIIDTGRPKHQFNIINNIEAKLFTLISK